VLLRYHACCCFRRSPVTAGKFYRHTRHRPIPTHTTRMLGGTKHTQPLASTPSPNEPTPLRPSCTGSPKQVTTMDAPRACQRSVPTPRVIAPRAVSLFPVAAEILPQAALESAPWQLGPRPSIPPAAAAAARHLSREARCAAPSQTCDRTCTHANCKLPCKLYSSALVAVRKRTLDPGPCPRAHALMRRPGPHPFSATACGGNRSTPPIQREATPTRHTGGFIGCMYWR
jgi:hypothetical protein